ncbi:MAG TPA: glycosyltransferase family 4 protein [Candidatus Acidoferrales bacterium]|nr:glycosyltransferase family 4 protein [Candidatus Acidoferrales bacterium]
MPDILPAAAFGSNRTIVHLWHLIGSPFKRRGGLVNNLLAYCNEVVGMNLALRSAALVVGSHLLAKELGVEGCERTFVTTNGVEHLAPRASEERHGALYVGRLHPTKSVEDLIAAWEIVHRTLPEEKIVLVGRGNRDYVDALRSLIAEKHLERAVVVREDVDNEEKGMLLGSAEVFAFPSREEGWGIAVAEAMAAGVPCVTYDLPIFQEIFPEGRSIAPIDDVGAFAQRLLELLTDERLRAKLAGEAAQLGSTFTWERAAEIESSAIEYVIGLARSANR